MTGNTLMLCALSSRRAISVFITKMDSSLLLFAVFAQVVNKTRRRRRNKERHDCHQRRSLQWASAG